MSDNQDQHPDLKTTPGEWTVKYYDDLAMYAIETDDAELATLDDWTEAMTQEERNEQLYNALLMSRSKKLFEALAACVDVMGELPTLNGFVGLAVFENAQNVLNEVKDSDNVGWQRRDQNREKADE